MLSSSLLSSLRSLRLGEKIFGSRALRASTVCRPEMRNPPSGCAAPFLWYWLPVTKLLKRGRSMRLLLLLCVLVWPAVIRAELVQKGKPFPAYALPDPHGVTNTLSRETRAVILSCEKHISGDITAWLKGKPAGFLETHRAEYVSDITPMPGLITTLFALPKMRKYPFRMLLADDPDFARIYPRQEDRITLFLLDENHVVQDLLYLAKASELDALLATLRR